jgi:hypothetical protein
MLNDASRPLHERIAEFSRAVAAEQPGDVAELAMFLEFFAALLRAPDALERYSSGLERQLQAIAETDTEEPLAGTTPVQAWTIGLALVVGLQIYQRMAPSLVTPELIERALGLMAGLYEEQ